MQKGGEKNQDFMLMRFFNPSDLIGRGGDPKPMRFKVCGRVRRGSECKKVIAWRGAWRGVQRGARRV